MHIIRGKHAALILRNVRSSLAVLADPFFLVAAILLRIQDTRGGEADREAVEQ